MTSERYEVRNDDGEIQSDGTDLERQQRIARYMASICPGRVFTVVKVVKVVETEIYSTRNEP